MRSCGYLQGKTEEHTEQRGESRRDPEEAARGTATAGAEAFDKEILHREAASAKAARQKHRALRGPAWVCSLGPCGRNMTPLRRMVAWWGEGERRS